MPGGVAQDAAQRDPVLHARGRAGRAPATERRDERRVEVGGGPLREPQHAERGERLGHGAGLEPRVGRDVADGADPRDVAAVDHGERRPRHPGRPEGGACRALDARGEVLLLAGLAFLAVTRGLDRAGGRRDARHRRPLDP